MFDTSNRRCNKCLKPRTSQVFDEETCAICLAEEDIRIKEIYNNLIISWLKTGSYEDSNTILVWKFYDAPTELRALSLDGGDEDWLVYVPSKVEFVCMPLWIESMASCRDPDEFKLPNGARVYIGAH